MQTEELIKSLTQDMQPTSPHALSQRLIKAALTGVAGTLLIFLAGYPLRSDILSAITDWPTLIKLAYAASMALSAGWLCGKLARPGASTISMLWLPIVPALILGGGAIGVLDNASTAARHDLVFGHSALYCPFNITLLSLPVLFMLLRSLRQAAPTRLRLTAAVAGLASSAIAAQFYSLHCPESSIPFIAIWYTLGMIIPGMIGAAFGHRMLRWT